ncbi:MAG: beta-galactosidase [Lachnospiraceae bacterium]|nr:beta-galactosidase [Lachnospiraceae bacterium]
MLKNRGINKVLYGGDYNPEQWDERTRDKDMILLDKAGIDIVTLNVFAWAMIQPSENVYDFSDLDSIVKRVTDKGMKICMATSTAAYPAWMARKYPDILRVDYQGRKKKFGARHNACPNSETYRKFAPLLAGKLAEHFKDCDSIVVWHINNEYSGSCYCENCERAFRGWLKGKYGSLDELNRAWNSPFWSHVFYDWDEIVAPNELSEYQGGEKSQFPGLALDYARFMSDSILQNYKDERDAIKSVIPDAVCTTNMMNLFKGLDYRKWAKEIDIASWDNYPQRFTAPFYDSFAHELIRGLKGGKPFMLMEQSPSVTNWMSVNSLKRPGEMRRYSYEAMAHGADTLMFFQMRQSPAGTEMYHGAVIDHSGREDTRTFKECSLFGEELKKIGDLTLSGKAPSECAIIFDWPTWWAIEDIGGISENFKYPDEILNYYRAFYELNIPVDIIGSDDDISGYRIVIAPSFYMVHKGDRERFEDFVRNGGTLVFTYYSGYVDENAHILKGGYPGELRELIGARIEESDCLYENMDRFFFFVWTPPHIEDTSNSFTYKGKDYPAKKVCDIMHAEKAEVLSEFREDFYKGSPAITKNSLDKGNVYYAATGSVPEFYGKFIMDLCVEAGVKDCLGNEPEDEGEWSGLEISLRVNDKGKMYYYINHSDQAKNVMIPFDCSDILKGEKIGKGDMAEILPGDVRLLFVKM